MVTLFNLPADETKDEVYHGEQLILSTLHDCSETLKDQRVAGNNTILDGEGNYRVFCNDYSSSNPLTNSAKLDNVTIQNGYASDGNDNSSSTADYGAADY